MFPMKNVFRSSRRLAAGLALVVAATLALGKGTLLATPAPAAQEKSLIYAGWHGNCIPTPSFIQTRLR